MQLKAATLVRRLRRETGAFTCMHLADLDTAVINSRAPLAAGTLETESVDLDIHEPAATAVDQQAGGVTAV